MNSLLIKTNNINSVGDRLSYLREMCSISRMEFSNLSKISYNTLKHWERVNPHSLKLNTATKIVKDFESLGIKCSVNWLIKGIGDPPSFIEEKKEENLKIDYTDESNNLREVEFFRSINPNSVSFIITDNSMSPLYEPGDIVAGLKKIKDEIDQKALNKNCIIESVEGIKLVRKLVKGNSQNTYNLHPLNGSETTFPILPHVRLVYAAPIIWHRKKDI